MIIRDVKTKPITLPLRKPFVFFLGTLKELNYGLVEITAELKGGKMERGIGEFACPWPITGETQAGFVEVVNKFFRPILLNRKIKCVADIDSLNQEMARTIPFNPSSKAAVEMAVFDLLGKEKNASVHDLLGGKKRDSVGLTYVLTMDSEPGSRLKEAKQAIAKGFTNLKLKVGKEDSSDLEKVRLLSSLTGDGITLCLDANGAWGTVEKSISMIRQLEQFNISWIEDPVRDAEELAKIRKESALKIMADASLWGPEDARKLIGLKACDIFNIKLHEAGGILRSKQILDLAVKNGVECIIGSCIETEVGTAASVHVACLSESVLTTELVGVYEISKRIASGVESFPGRINVPTGPGLGIKLLGRAIR